MKKRLFFLSFLLLSLLLTVNTFATHLRAGQITAVRDPSNLSTPTYIFTLTLYRDTQGVDQPEATIGIVPILANGQRGNNPVFLRADANTPRRTVGVNIEEITYTFNYTFPGSGSYVIYFQEQNRNAEIVNMNNSVNTPFYVETMLNLVPTIGNNSTPQLLNPPIDNAKVGQKFTHNPTAFDPDGDSLAYRMVIPRQSTTLSVNGYQSPETVGPPLGIPEAGSGSPTFVINPLTGDIIWDAPGVYGIGTKGYANYGIAFVVEEWRKTAVGYIKIGEIVRDMQITVREQPNKRPELIIPKDTCIVAGTVLKAIIRATDPDQNQSIRISSESAIFSTSTALFPNQPAATLDPPNHPPKVRDQYQYQGNPAQSNFEWKTVCEQVRAQPYDVVFKAEDNAPVPNQLTDTKTWRVTIVNQPPTNVQAHADGQSIKISWDAYTCSSRGVLYIWRKEGCETGVIPAYTIGAPANYTLIGRASLTTTSFLDELVKPGTSYQYLVSSSIDNRLHSLSTDPSCTSLLLKPGTPTTQITSPASNDTIAPSSSLTIQANATDTDGSIAKVEFFTFRTKIGEALTAPFSITWADVKEGTYPIFTRVTDNEGNINLSDEIIVTVKDIVNATEPHIKRKLITYPNPFLDEIFIQYNYPIESISLINQLGVEQRISYEVVGNQSYLVRTNALPTGIYLLKIQDKNGQQLVQKIIH
ncbi:Ig-like domain-containing protein [Xanthocytophaga agilis]|uniref:Ig-like domain-containing protein n=1 Tax=Xanthocytophaga agilis TaxID=3048010 RepID=A0AAE3R231_9BACT|nr:Ig-like domain-containing protein [Xanthocytophaga agilis]MDJ1502319.1 Ig-like domain-containing protein [Xanthocytophaga agilis]